MLSLNVQCLLLLLSYFVLIESVQSGPFAIQSNDVSEVLVIAFFSSLVVGSSKGEATFTFRGVSGHGHELEVAVPQGIDLTSMECFLPSDKQTLIPFVVTFDDANDPLLKIQLQKVDLQPPFEGASVEIECINIVSPTAENNTYDGTTPSYSIVLRHNPVQSSIFTSTDSQIIYQGNTYILVAPAQIPQPIVSVQSNYICNESTSVVWNIPALPLSVNQGDSFSFRLLDSAKFFPSNDDGYLNKKIECILRYVPPSADQLTLDRNLAEVESIETEFENKTSQALGWNHDSTLLRLRFPTVVPMNVPSTISCHNLPMSYVENYSTDQAEFSIESTKKYVIDTKEAVLFSRRFVAPLISFYEEVLPLFCFNQLPMDVNTAMKHLSLTPDPENGDYARVRTKHIIPHIFQDIPAETMLSYHTYGDLSFLTEPIIDEITVNDRVVDPSQYSSAPIYHSFPENPEKFLDGFSIKFKSSILQTQAMEVTFSSSVKPARDEGFAFFALRMEGLQEIATFPSFPTIFQGWKDAAFFMVSYSSFTGKPAASDEIAFIQQSIEDYVTRSYNYSASCPQMTHSFSPNTAKGTLYVYCSSIPNLSVALSNVQRKRVVLNEKWQTAGISATNIFLDVTAYPEVCFSPIVTDDVETNFLPCVVDAKPNSPFEACKFLCPTSHTCTQDSDCLSKTCRSQDEDGTHKICIETSQLREFTFGQQVANFFRKMFGMRPRFY